MHYSWGLKYIAGNNEVEGAQISATYFDRFGSGLFGENVIYAVPTN
ncbi:MULTISPECIES: hypothetical protein [Chryseobacterium]|nr:MULTISPECIES: hypothetical protein [Chryseobacterium]MDM1554486.1 hypothetical protein [Chryseobacterium indologenes]